MPRRGASPTPSEGEIDIFGSLYPGETDNANGGNGGDDFDFDGLLNNPEPGNDDTDEAFIALQQAASFRKATNLKGRTVKKGGGFQAMGKESNGWSRESILTNPRFKQQSPKSYYKKGFLGSYPHSTKSYSFDSRQKGFGRHGPDRFRKNCRLRYSHDRKVTRPQR